MKIRNEILIIVFLIVLSSFKSEKNKIIFSNEGKNKIYWSDSVHLHYSDFTGKIPGGTSWAALTESAIDLTYGYDDDSVFNVKVLCYFDKENSWMKSKTTDVLSHEQLHFEISEVYARMLRKKISETKDWGGNPHNTMEKIFTELNNESNVLQNLYDKETAHGTIPLKQTQWKTKIDLMLAEYSAWKN